MAWLRYSLHLYEGRSYSLHSNSSSVGESGENSRKGGREGVVSTPAYSMLYHLHCKTYIISCHKHPHSVRSGPHELCTLLHFWRQSQGGVHLENLGSLGPWFSPQINIKNECLEIGLNLEKQAFIVDSIR